nr:hypothetical protein OG781_13420 [Streptomyces sp. NBC_00830]
MRSPADQIANRHKRGSHGGRPPKFDKDDYKGATPSSAGATASSATGA